MSTGNRRIEQNPEVKPELYDSLDLRSNQSKLFIAAAGFLGFGKRSTIKTGIQAGGILGEKVFNNELYRIGGIQTLRGFDIESIQASMYGILTVEYRYLLERRSYLSLFTDLAYYENVSLDQRIFDRPYGFGAGMAFDTKSGVFSLSYALGSEKGNPILFRSSKIHFGFVNVF